MARRYSVTAPTEAGAGPKTAINIIGSTTVRPQLYDVIAGISTTPADQTFQFVVARTTAVGTTAASAPTPAKLDDGDVAAVCTVGWTHSAEPTYASVFLLDVQLNVRATFRWVASPGGELFGTASANNGIGIKNHLASASSTMRATAHWCE